MVVFFTAANGKRLSNGDIPHDVNVRPHQNDLMVSTMASQITGVSMVYSTVYSGIVHRKQQSSASLTFVGGIMMFQFDDVILGWDLLSMYLSPGVLSYPRVVLYCCLI